MVYQARYVPGLPQIVPPATNPNSRVAVGNPRGIVRLMWKSNGDFYVGQPHEKGGWAYDEEHVTNVTNMTKEQLDEAAQEVNRDISGNELGKEIDGIMLRLARASQTVTEFFEKCNDNADVMTWRPIPYEAFLEEEYDTIEEVITELERRLAEIGTNLATQEALRLQIEQLGGKTIPRLTGKSLSPDEVNVLKEKVGEIEQHLVPVPGTPETVEDLPDVWPDPIPELPTIPTAPSAGDDQYLWARIEYMTEYLIAMKAYEISKQFNICWCLEQIRVCLSDLSKAKAPGTQEDAFKANLEGLGDGLHELETKGVFHD